MDTVIQIAINSVLVLFGIALVAGTLTLAGQALAAESAEDTPDSH